MRRPPAGAVCSMRAAMLTATAADAALGVDAAAEQHAAGVDADAHVEASVAMLGAAPRSPCCRPSASSARPARTARSASSSRASSAPNTASRLSPAYCSTLPPCASTIAVQRASAPSITAWMSSGSRCWPSAVEPTMSRNRIVDLLEDLLRRVVGRRRFEGNELAAQGNDRRIDHRIAENRALGVERGDGRFELLPLRGHRVVGMRACSRQAQRANITRVTWEEEAAMKLYYHPVSTTSRPVVLFATESGIELDYQLVDLFTGEQYKPEYSAINPSHQVPVLEDGDFRLTESSAILKYLADKVAFARVSDRPARSARASTSGWTGSTPASTATSPTASSIRRSFRSCGGPTTRCRRERSRGARTRRWAGSRSSTRA